MKVLLVTTTNKLAEKFAALSPELEYCAAVVDNVELAKEIFAQVGLPQVPLYPMSEFQEYAESLQYDYALFVQDKLYGEKIKDEFLKYGVPNNKIVSLGALSSSANLLVERALRYYQEHCSDFEMFATGISQAYGVLDATQFKYNLFNIAKPSQDLYYDFLVAKYIFLCGGGIVRFVTPSSVLHLILFTMIFRRHLVTDNYSCSTLLLLMTCIIFSFRAMFTKSFCARNI